MLVLLAFVMPVTAHAGTRVALVVGISSYRALPALENPGHDAATVAGALRGVGFKVTELTQPAQLTRAALGAALLSFGRQAQGAEAAVVYFAGHGVEVNGANWLLPSDVTAETPDHLQVTAIPAAAAINAVRGASAIRLVILDACRDNPFALNPGWAHGNRSFGTRGLGREASRADNVVLLLATQPGTKASDGSGSGNSPFAKALAATLTTEGMQISALPAMVSRRMRDLTGVEQRPDQQGIFDEPAWLFRQGMQAAHSVQSASAASALNDAAARLENRKQWFAVISGGDIDMMNRMVAEGRVTFRTVVDDEMNTPLHLASERCNLELIRYLLDRGGNPDIQNGWKDSALTIARVRCPGGVNSAQYKALLAKSANYGQVPMPGQ